MMHETEETIGELYALEALGIRLTVDDFGTEYSSMVYLSSLPIDTLKIDRAFVGKMSKHAEDAAIGRARDAGESVRRSLLVRVAT